MNATVPATCPHCGGDHEVTVDPASLLGKGKKKTMTDAAKAARKANASKPRPNARKVSR